jgi:hypothetical protein
MTGEHRDTTWRQGAVFTLPNEQGDDVLGVIATHDCDICADSSIEPSLEYIPAIPADKLDGNLTFGKHPRTLHVTVINDNNGEQIVELDVRARLAIDKNAFFNRAAFYSHQLQSRDVVVFRRWLSARYGRSAFANAFEDQMRRVTGRIDRLAQNRGTGIRALYFDVDENQLMERSAADAPYELAIYVVYPSDTRDEDAESFATALADIFKNEFLDLATATWSGIELLSCDPIAEDVFPLVLHLSTKPWRVDHRSYKGLPEKGLYPEPDR